MPIRMTYHLAMAAGWDAGNRHMQKAGRTAWDLSDWEAARLEFERLWPEEGNDGREQDALKLADETLAYFKNGERIADGLNLAQHARTFKEDK